MPHFANLELRILDATDQGYPVELTLDDAREFPRAHLAPIDPSQLPPAYEPQAYGEVLFRALLADPATRATWAEVKGGSEHRRLRLRIDADAPELHGLKWELLRDPEQEIELAADGHTPFSRYLAGGWTPGDAVQAGPVQVLVAVAAPDNAADYGLAEIDVEGELANVQAALGGLDLALTILPQPCTLDALEDALVRGVHILHVVAHGQVSATNGRGALCLADRHNEVDMVNDIRLASMVKRVGGSVEAADRLRFVFLASCLSAARAATDTFQGVGPQLVKAGVPAILAMQESVSMEGVRAFTQTFYRRLVDHGLVDLAANEARGKLLTLESSDVAAPVLFMRLHDGRLLASGLTELGDIEEPEGERAMSKGEDRSVSAGGDMKGNTIITGDNNTNVDTGGGAYVGGSVSASGDFVGRDKIVHGDEVHGDKVGGDKVGGDKITVGDVSGTGIAIGAGASANVQQGISGADLAKILGPVTAAIYQSDAAQEKRDEAVVQVEELKSELAKGSKADDNRVAGILDGIAELVPGAVGAVVSAFGTPLLGGIAGPVTQFVLGKLRRQAG